MIQMEGLNELVADLTAAPLRAHVGAIRAVEGAARRGAEEARRLAPGGYRGSRLPHYPRSITHDSRWTAIGAVGEFGPERGGQGSLGHILENGTARTPPHAHVGPAFDRGQPDFIDEIARLA